MNQNAGQPQSSVRAGGRFDGVLLLLLILSLAANVMLAYKAAASTRFVTASPNTLVTPSLGTRMPPLEVRTLDGTPTTVRFDQELSDTIVYVFAPECRWCLRNEDNVLALSTSARTKGLRFIGISLDPAVAEYSAQHTMDFPIYVSPSASSIAAYGLAVTPQTFVISREGVLEREWKGAYTGANQRELETWLGIALPGLTPVSTHVIDDRNR